VEMVREDGEGVHPHAEPTGRQREHVEEHAVRDRRRPKQELPVAATPRDEVRRPCEDLSRCSHAATRRRPRAGAESRKYVAERTAGGTRWSARRTFRPRRITLGRVDVMRRTSRPRRITLGRVARVERREERGGPHDGPPVRGALLWVGLLGRVARGALLWVGLLFPLLWVGLLGVGLLERWVAVPLLWVGLLGCWLLGSARPGRDFPALDAMGVELATHGRPRSSPP
jgi:hypothetical protein